MPLMTASWFTPLPITHLRVGISLYPPRNAGKGYRLYKKLAPGSWFNSVTVEEYRRRYFEEILGPLDPYRVRDELQQMAGDRIPVMLCFEKPGRGEWCHRGMVSAWMADRLGEAVVEFGFPDNSAYGWKHPMLPPELRK